MFTKMKTSILVIALLIMMLGVSTQSYALSSNDLIDVNQTLDEFVSNPTIYRTITVSQPKSIPGWATNYYWEETIWPYVYVGNLPLTKNEVVGDTRYLTYSGTLTGYIANKLPEH